MKVLLDECVPKGVKHMLIGHETVTVQDLGWAGIRNGNLLAAAESGDFDVLITCDKNLPYQQRLSGRSVSVVQLPTNRLSVLKRISDKILETVNSAVKGSFYRIEL
jgi:predicted nuclease of predicted toxin-antitoxin system